MRKTVDQLWPSLGTQSGCHSRVVLPAMRTPRLLVPVAPRRAAAAAVVRYTAQQNRRNRMSGVALAAAVSAGLCSFLRPVTAANYHNTGTESIDDYLTDVLGTKVTTALALTTLRANRKPILQAFDLSGRTLAFVKVGVNPLTRGLVDREAEVLAQLSNTPLHHDLTIPRVIHHGSWRTNAVLVMSPLRAGRKVAASSPALDRALRTVSRLTAQPDAGCARYIAQLRSEALEARRRVPDPARVDAWLHVSDTVAAQAASHGFVVGAWHGDWTAWNCSVRRRRISLWDWERFEYAAPQGFDILHYTLNHSVGPDRRRFLQASTQLMADAAALLSPWRLNPAVARATVSLYLLKIALRYISDGAPVHSVGSKVEEWAYPAINQASSGATRMR